MRDRTADLLNANQALSQLSYSPMFFGQNAADRGAVTRSVRVARERCGNEELACFGRPGQI